MWLWSCPSKLRLQGAPDTTGCQCFCTVVDDCPHSSSLHAIPTKVVTDVTATTTRIITISGQIVDVRYAGMTASGAMANAAL